MKKTIKPIAVILLLAMVLFTVVSCAGNDTEEVFDESLIDETAESKTDFGGQNVVFLTAWYEEWVLPVGFSTMGDNQLARFKEIENLYNCTVEFVNYEGNPSGYIMPRLASQQDIPDLVDYHTYQVMDLYKADMLYAMNDIETIDLNDSKWGDYNFIRYGRFDGNQYGFFTYDWQFLPAIQGICVFDSYLLNNFGLENPHEMLENGKWTWSEFEKMLDTATVAEGDREYHGLARDNDVNLAQAAIFSNGGEVVTEDENGKKASVTSENVLNALDWLASLNQKGYITGYSHESFNNHETLFVVGESWYFTHMSENHQSLNTPVYGHSGYGFIPFPSGPLGEYGRGGQYVSENRRLNWIVDAGPMDKDELGILLNLFCEPLEGTGEKAWNEFLETNVFHYREADSKVFMNMVESVHYDWSAELETAYDSLSSKYSSVIAGKDSAASAMSAVDSVINEKLK